MRLLVELIQIYKYILIASVILSWVAPQSEHPIVRFIARITDPVLEPLRRVIPPIAGLDFSPWIAILILNFLPRLFF